MRLIDAAALKKQVKELLDLAVKRVNDTPTNSPCYRMYVEQENERARLLDLIDNAPTVKDRSLEIAQKSIELGRKVGQLEGKLERPQGEWINREAVSNTTFPFWERYECNQCHKFNGYSNFCPNCGADMRGE